MIWQQINLAINNLVKTNLTNHQAVKHQIIIKILNTYTKFKPQKINYL